VQVVLREWNLDAGGTEGLVHAHVQVAADLHPVAEVVRPGADGEVERVRAETGEQDRGRWLVCDSRVDRVTSISSSSTRRGSLP